MSNNINRIGKKPEKEFYEVQKFKSPFIRCSLVFMTLFFVIFFGNGAIHQIAYGKPWGTHPLSNTALITTGAVILFFMLALDFFFFFLHLTVTVKKDGLHINLFPLAKRTIPFEEIKSSSPVTYNAIKDYGGWGVKNSMGKKTYTLCGNQGVEVQLVNNITILIGSQRPHELHNCISTHIKGD